MWLKHLLKAGLTEDAAYLPSQAASPTGHPLSEKQQLLLPDARAPNARVTLDSCPFPDPFCQQILLALPSKYILSPATHLLSPLSSPALSLILSPNQVTRTSGLHNLPILRSLFPHQPEGCCSKPGSVPPLLRALGGLPPSPSLRVEATKAGVA